MLATDGGLDSHSISYLEILAHLRADLDDVAREFMTESYGPCLAGNGMRYVFERKSIGCAVQVQVGAADAAKGRADLDLVGGTCWLGVVVFETDVFGVVVTDSTHVDGLDELD